MGLLDFVPLPYRIGGLVLGFAGAGLYGYVQGLQHGQQAAQQAAAAQASMVQRIAVRQGAVSVQTVTQYVDRIKTITQKGSDVYREVPVYVRDNNSSSSCAKSLGSVGVLVGAAESGSTLPSTPSNTDAPGTSPAAVAEWAVTVVNQYQQVSEQLSALQGWVVQQQKAAQPQ